MEYALYGDLPRYGPLEYGYYNSKSQKSARRGDYITSVEIGPLFGVVLAKALDSWWQDLGRPKEFYVFDAGAGVGSLARSILRAKPACLEALKYVLVERSDYLISQHSDLKKDFNNIQSLKVNPGETIPHEQVDFGVVIANELLDNLPVALLEKTDYGWVEIGVGLEKVKDEKVKDEKIKDEIIAKEAKPTKKFEFEASNVALAEKLVSNAKVGQRIPIQNQARDWLKGALSVIKQGRVVVFDYGVLTTEELSNRPQDEWLRTYQGHSRGGSVYDFVGKQDITCEIALDQLDLDSKVQSQPEFLKQADFLRQHGIEDLVVPNDSGVIPTNLEDIELYSRVPESKALLDPLGLGAHLVAQWVK